MIGFLTGSRVYGTPREDSDYDVVIGVTQEAFDALIETSNLEDKTVYGDTVTIRHGKLNLIITTCERQWSIWRLGTSILKGRGIVTRDEAVKQFRSLMDAK